MTSKLKTNFTSAAFLDATPAGSVAVAVSEKGLARLFFSGWEGYVNFLADNDLPEGDLGSGFLSTVMHQVREYFEGSRKSFDLPLDLSGQSPFRDKALRECSKIPFGRTITYSELAARAGNQKASRAAGGAMANNPIALVIPCHRVVGSDKALHGFSSPGGLGTKAILLRHEGVVIKNERVV